MCPDPPIRGPRNTSGIIRWGCDIGCRNREDGLTAVNLSAQDMGVAFGDRDHSVAVQSISVAIVFWIAAIYIYL